MCAAATMSAYQGAYTVLTTASPREKAKAARQFFSDWQHHHLIGTLVAALPSQPARPEKPELVAPTQVPRRRLGSVQGRAAMLHAIAHIELNAIDLAADMIARFAHNPLISAKDRADFITDWASVCDDEARHFLLLQDRLEQLGMSYGDFPSHNGLWDAAMDTCETFPARLAIAPLVLEARGLDVTPNMIKKLIQAQDIESANILKTIYDEEIGHVRIGAKWFQYAARALEESPKALFHKLVKNYFKGQIRPPFNVEARNLAGLTEEYYRPLAKL